MERYLRPPREKLRTVTGSWYMRFGEPSEPSALTMRKVEFPVRPYRQRSVSLEGNHRVKLQCAFYAEDRVRLLIFSP